MPILTRYVLFELTSALIDVCLNCETLVQSTTNVFQISIIVIMSPDDKDAALLPHKIGGLWALIHRPMTPLGPRSGRTNGNG